MRIYSFLHNDSLNELNSAVSILLVFFVEGEKYSRDKKVAGKNLTDDHTSFSEVEPKAVQVWIVEKNEHFPSFSID